jgi:1-acyl-sn-glycerol-3-phosphate acyltransferase
VVVIAVDPLIAGYGGGRRVCWHSPEVTRSLDGALGPFKKGGFMLALQTGAMIVPIGICGTLVPSVVY